MRDGRGLLTHLALQQHQRENVDDIRDREAAERREEVEVQAWQVAQGWVREDDGRQRRVLSLGIHQ